MFGIFAALFEVFATEWLIDRNRFYKKEVRLLFSLIFEQLFFY